MNNLSRRGFLHAGAMATTVFSRLESIGATKDDSSEQEWPDNLFLKGNFAPIHDEVTADDLKVIGKLPQEINGMFLRNGPNPQFPPIKNYHWFDGDGMVHGVRIRDGKASYLNRYVQTNEWKAERKAGKALWRSAMDPFDIPDLFAKMARGEGKFPYKNPANTALVWHHGRLLALFEGALPYEMTLPNLKTKGSYDFQGTIKNSFSAHPKLDPATGEMMTIGIWPFKPFVRYSVINAEGRISHTTPIDVRRAVMMHDMGITQRYSVFLEVPAVLEPFEVINGKPLIQYRPDFGARIGVLPRHAAGDKMKWFEIKTCFVFHIVNAFERDDEVIVFACRYEKYPAMGVGVDVTNEDMLALWGSGRPVLYRWTLNMKNGKVTEHPLDDRANEFPRINESLVGKPNRYGYTMSSDAHGTHCLQKTDLTTDTAQQHVLGKGRHTGEAVFVASPDAKSEDDGWLLSHVHDDAEQQSEVLIVDAQEFDQPPVARIMMPQRVPYGFHGLWVDGVNL